LEVAKIQQSGMIKFKNSYPKNARLKPGVTPEQAIEARNRVDQLEFLGGARRQQNNKFLRDMDAAKREAVFIEKEVGIPVAQNENLKLLNYAKGNLKKDEVFSFARIFDAAKGRFDPAVRMHNRPSVEAAQAYYNELERATNIKRSSAFVDEAQRIRSLNFD
jgi:hypothetical protein